MMMQEADEDTGSSTVMMQEAGEDTGSSTLIQH
jgi:hypothetical protein